MNKYVAVPIEEQRAMLPRCADCGAPGASVQVDKGQRWVAVCVACWKWRKGERS